MGNCASCCTGREGHAAEGLQPCEDLPHLLPELPPAAAPFEPTKSAVPPLRKKDFPKDASAPAGGFPPNARAGRRPSFTQSELAVPGHEVLPGADEQPAAPIMATPRLVECGAEERPEVGDIVCLTSVSPREFPGQRGVVMDIAEKHVTVTMLDASGCIGVGELWPSLVDVMLVRKDWRLGSRVIIDGFQRDRAQKLNGCVGVISRHPRSGHPSFILKPNSKAGPRLTFCVRLDVPAANGGKAAVLVEPRFLRPYGVFLRQVSADAQSLATSEGGFAELEDL